MPAKKPSLQEVMEAVQTLNVGMGAELVALRAEVEKQNQTIVGLSHMLAKDWVTKTAESLVATQPMGAQLLYSDNPPPIYTADQIYEGAMPLNAPEKSMATGGFVIDAIKAYRMRIEKLTGTVPGLKASKDLVEEYKNKGQYTMTPPLHGTYTSNQVINAEVPMNADEIALACKPDKVKAIITYRDRVKALTGLMPGLKETKLMVEAYVDNMPSKPSFDAANPLPVPVNCQAFILAGKKIDAIKAYREFTMMHCCVGGHAGLKEAKDVIDNYITGVLGWDPYNLPGV